MKDDRIEVLEMIIWEAARRLSDLNRHLKYDEIAVIEKKLRAALPKPV